MNDTFYQANVSRMVFNVGKCSKSRALRRDKPWQRPQIPRDRRESSIINSHEFVPKRKRFFFGLLGAASGRDFSLICICGLENASFSMHDS